ncbi:MAG: HIT family protein [Acidimicrobiaceae bacterium]|nr:HIT family protein [Acidimicrobiaceae bacterium]MCY4176763.1 HIT family protein [Acidimicrobiaceae bacterium]MCY4280955.1 HIT family protein [Acidimicrobiaceae bacterium]MCY4295151.1 HIT family protein [Acidimicrobiaceae bacterium]
MSSVFTRIIDGELPGRFVWQDDCCVVIVNIRPLNRGHVLVVPRREVDHWVDLDNETANHLMTVSHRVAAALQACGLAPHRVGLMIAGFEVPHVHLHVLPISTMEHFDFDNADADPDPDDLDMVAGLLSAELGAHPAA